MTLTGAPAQAGLTTGCWRYTLTGTDNVGQHRERDHHREGRHVGPGRSERRRSSLGETGPFAFVSGTTAYYNGATGAGSTITVAAPTVADADSGVAQVAFPAPAGFTGGGADTTAPFGATYTWAAATGTGRTDGHGHERRRAREPPRRSRSCAT